MNLFKIVKYHAEEFIKECEYLLNAREMFKQYKDINTRKHLTDIQRASNFYMLIKTSYGSKCENFGAVKKDKINALEYIREINKRLSNVIIENLDFEKLIKKYDKEKTLFYLDPPYYNTESYYKEVEFKKEDHERLYKILKDAKSKWIVSYNDCEYIRNLYKDYKIDEVERINNLASRYKESNSIYKELIIKNY